MFSEFYIPRIQSQIEDLGMVVLGIVSKHPAHFSIVIYPAADNDMMFCDNLVTEILHGNGLHVTGIFENIENESYLFECLNLKYQLGAN